MIGDFNEVLTNSNKFRDSLGPILGLRVASLEKDWIDVGATIVGTPYTPTLMSSTYPAYILTIARFCLIHTPTHQPIRLDHSASKPFGYPTHHSVLLLIGASNPEMPPSKPVPTSFWMKSKLEIRKPSENTFLRKKKIVACFLEAQKALETNPSPFLQNLETSIIFD
ncbi:hypothetical protein ACSBR2_008998 [Camellia fascicularis]